MNRYVDRLVLGLSLTALFLSGCRPTMPFYFFEDGDLSHYKAVATDIDYPDVESDTLTEVQAATRPLSVRYSETHTIWDLTLEEAMQNALANSKVMRQIGGTVGNPAGGFAGFGPDTLLRSPSTAFGSPIQTVYDPALTESNPRTGVEGALSAFDAQFQTSTFWEKNDHPVNITGPFAGFLAQDFDQDLGTFQAQISKTAATGSTFTLRNNTRYEWNNNPSNLFPSVWNVNYEAEFRHPMLQGAGVQFNRIAGPGATPGSITFGFGNGVILARINMDISLAQFEAAVRNMVSDVEVAYWELYFRYRNLDALIAGRDSALETWRRVKALYDAGNEGGRAEEEAQAREQFYLFVDQVHRSLNDLYRVERRLRYMMGIAPSDGRLIRPADEPTIANVQFDWQEILTEGLARSVELRQQKWVIKRREMELIAARNFLLPRLDAVGRYRWVGFGNELINSNRDAGGVYDNAYKVLTGGDYQEWQLGWQLNIPLGFRQALTGVRNAQLALAKERSILQEQELELAHQLSNAMADLEGHYTAAMDNYNRRIAAQGQVDSVKAAYDAGQVTLDLLLDAQRRLADAESAYFRSLVDYNIGIENVHFRKGSLLEYNGVYLAEGPWPAKAYFDARKRARERDAGFYLNYGFTRPSVFSRGPFQQLQYRSAGQPVGPTNEPLPPSSEQIQTPSPEPYDQQPTIEPNGNTGRFTPPGQGQRLGAVGQPYSWGEMGGAAAPGPGVPVAAAQAPQTGPAFNQRR